MKRPDPRQMEYKLLDVSGKTLDEIENALTTHARERWRVRDSQKKDGMWNAIMLERYAAKPEKPKRTDEEERIQYEEPGERQPTDDDGTHRA